MVLIESEAQGPLGWFKLTWDGRGDMDLNLDVRAPGGHIGWDNPLYRENGYHIVLDR